MDYGKDALSDWYGVTQISVSDSHAVGLRWDGTLFAYGDNVNGQCEVNSLHGIKAAYAYDGFTVAVRKDGSVIVIGNAELNTYVEDWKDITSI